MRKITKPLLAIFFILVLTFPAVQFFFNHQGFTFHDETQIANLYEYFKTIDQGQFPPRWASDVHFGFGSPLLEFNYQIPYYLGYFFHLQKIDVVGSFKLLLAFSVLIGALGMYFLAKKSASYLASISTSLLYVYTPYHAVDVFVRGTLGESFALAFFPWLFLAFTKLFELPNLINLVLAGLMVGLLITTHQVAAIFFLAFCLFIFTFVGLFSKKIKGLFAIYLSCFAGLLPSAYYWLPILTEKNLLIQGSPFNFYDHFPFLKQLVYSPWGYGASVPGPGDGLSFQIGFVNLFVIGLAVLVLALNFKGIKQNLFLLFALTAIFISVFLMNIRSSLFWQYFPFTNDVQFPWRLLMIPAFLTCLCLIYLQRFFGRWQKVINIGIILASFILVLPYYHPGELADHWDSYYLRRFLPYTILLPGEKVSSDYLNFAEDYVPLPNNSSRPDGYYPRIFDYDAKNLEVSQIIDKDFSYQADLKASSSANLSFRSYLYPGWQASLDNSPVAMKPGRFGSILIAVPAGQHRLEFKFEETPLRKIANYLSLGSLVAYLLIIIKLRFKKNG